MITAEDTGEQEKAAAKAIIDDFGAFNGIQRVDIELGHDHSGEPSMWLVFHLRHDLEADDKWIASFSEYSTKLGLRLLNSGITRFPYTRLEPAA